MYNVLIAGVGGTGVVTASGLLGLAAHLEGKAVHQLDQTGLAQKYGAVLSHVRIAADAEQLARHADPGGAGRSPARRRLDRRRRQGAAVDAVAGALGRHRQHARGDAVGFHPRPRLRVSRQALWSRCCARRGAPGAVATLDATRLASALLGDSIGANVLMLGFAFQRGLLPVSGAALYRALELYGRNVEENKLAFDWGRFAAESLEQVERLATAKAAQPAATSLARGDRAARGVPRRLPGSRLCGALSRARLRASPPRSSACGPAARRCTKPSRATTSACSPTRTSTRSRGCTPRAASSTASSATSATACA